MQHGRVAHLGDEVVGVGVAILCGFAQLAVVWLLACEGGLNNLLVSKAGVIEDGANGIGLRLAHDLACMLDDTCAKNI
jgi:hypothetical protein